MHYITVITIKGGRYQWFIALPWLGPWGVYIGLSDPTKPCSDDDDYNYNDDMNADDDKNSTQYLVYWPSPLLSPFSILVTRFKLSLTEIFNCHIILLSNTWLKYTEKQITTISNYQLQMTNPSKGWSHNACNLQAGTHRQSLLTQSGSLGAFVW